MKRWIASLSTRAELLLVVLVAFGLPVVTSSIHGFGSASDSVAVARSDLRSLVLWETALLLVITWFLRSRDASRSWFGTRPRLRDTGRGLALAVMSYLAYWPTALLLQRLHPAPASIGSTIRLESVGWSTILAVSLVNPIFEEGVLLGYAARRLEELRGPRTAIAITVLLRMLYHTYQGPYGVLNIALLGWIFGAWYLRHRRLWPVLVAHALLDFVPLALAR